MWMQRISPALGWPAALREVGELQREMERLFGLLPGPRKLAWAGVFPAVNVTETKDSIFVRAELPGVRKQDIEITVEDNALILAGERQVGDGEKASWHRREREGGRFRRSIEVSPRIDADRVAARYVNGVLTVELPKAAEAKPRQIAVQAH